jgi:AbiTii-like protein
VLSRSSVRRVRHNVRLPWHEDTLPAQIEADALNDGVSLASALRKCVVLGGKANSEALRDWATRELHGYHGDEDLPEYRVISAPLLIDGVSGNYQITRQPWAPSALPDFAQEHITEKVQLRDGVGAIEALAQQADIKIAPAMASDLVRYMNAEHGDPYQQIVSLYWAVSPSAVHGALDRIRTALTQLVAEMRANMAGNVNEIPSSEAANQAVSVVVSGKRSRVNVTTAQASGEEASASASPPGAESSDSGFWTRGRKIGAFVVGAATVVGAVVGVLQVL